MPGAGKEANSRVTSAYNQCFCFGLCKGGDADLPYLMHFYDVILEVLLNRAEIIHPGRFSIFVLHGDVSS